MTDEEPIAVAGTCGHDGDVARAKLDPPYAEHLIACLQSEANADDSRTYLLDYAEQIDFMNRTNKERVERLENKLLRLKEGLRWIAAGKTGSYGSLREFACALLAEAENA